MMNRLGCIIPASVSIVCGVLFAVILGLLVRLALWWVR